MGLFSISPEIFTLIFQNCDSIVDLLAFAATCKHIQSVWLENSSTIVWEVSINSIRCFDDALMVVRATAIALEAYKAGRQPPITPMHELSGRFSKPSWDELKEVLNVQHLIRCIEYMYWNSTIDGENLFGGCVLPSELREQPEENKQEAWKNRFYRAMYRLLLAGAVLARAYTEPFYQAQNDGLTDFLKHFERKDLGDADNEDGGFKGEYADYLRKFPVYNFDIFDNSNVGKWKYREYDNLLGPFSSWLVEDANLRAPPPEKNPTLSDSHNFGPHGKKLLEDLMCLLVAYEHLACKFTNNTDESSMGRYPNKRIPSPSKRNARKVTIILFGVFQVEQITMPADITETKNFLLTAESHPDLHTKDGALFGVFDIPAVINGLESEGRRRDLTGSEEHRSPPATFELWHFTLRKYLNLGFSERAFWIWRECTWVEDVGCGTVFVRPSWNIVERYRPDRSTWMTAGSDGYWQLS
ncbi:hypothetical protein B0O99DRAFT_626577 [Bisporella sp. PMI_857]|nr:hypothetical protein B0O99DRAFT_626577 [Bisporella sp. PMI_857]